MPPLLNRMVVQPASGRNSATNPEERPSVQQTTAASRPAWLIDSADFWRLWFVGLVVFSVRWVETVAVGCSSISTPAPPSSSP